MQRILVSACLLGFRVRYDGAAKSVDSPILQRWLTEGRVISVCPEVSAGLSIPRPAAEISSGAGGAAVLSGDLPVVDRLGNRFTQEFVTGAHEALALVHAHGIRIAILKDGSPSCGSQTIFDGSFSGRRVPGAGVTAALLRQSGILVFSEVELVHADEVLAKLDIES